MKYEEVGVMVFTMTPSEVKHFITEANDGFVNVEIFGKTLTLGKDLSKKKLYIHKSSDLNFAVGSKKRFEFNLVEERNLLEFYKENGWKTPEEKSQMFSDYKITDVEFGEVSDIALETAVEKIAHELEGVELKTKGDKTYLVKNGKAIELKGEEFTSMVRKYVVGKTVSSLRKNKEMYLLIQNLGIINKVTLTNVESDLSSIFG